MDFILQILQAIAQGVLKVVGFLFPSSLKDFILGLLLGGALVFFLLNYLQNLMEEEEREERLKRIKELELEILEKKRRLEDLETKIQMKEKELRSLNKEIDDMRDRETKLILRLGDLEDEFLIKKETIDKELEEYRRQRLQEIEREIKSKAFEYIKDVASEQEDTYKDAIRVAEEEIKRLVEEKKRLGQEIKRLNDKLASLKGQVKQTIENSILRADRALLIKALRKRNDFKNIVEKLRKL